MSFFCITDRQTLQRERERQSECMYETVVFFHTHHKHTQSARVAATDHYVLLVAILLDKQHDCVCGCGAAFESSLTVVERHCEWVRERQTQGWGDSLSLNTPSQRQLSNFCEQTNTNVYFIRTQYGEIISAVHKRVCVFIFKLLAMIIFFIINVFTLQNHFFSTEND